jgi:hypothetical protein
MLVSAHASGAVLLEVEAFPLAVVVLTGRVATLNL